MKNENFKIKAYPKNYLAFLLLDYSTISLFNY